MKSIYKVNSLLMLCILLIISCSTDPNGNNIEEDENTIEPETRLIPYGNHPLQNFDIYLPEEHDENTKVIIMIHGGGWVMGYEPNAVISSFSGRFGWDILNPLIEEGYACVVMKYRTACYNTVPENFNSYTLLAQNNMMEDIDLVIDYLKAKSSIYKISNNHFQLLGESAGGHIVLTYGIQQNSDTDVKSVVSMFGPTNLDATNFKTIINSLPTIPLVPPPNYFLKKSNNCESVTLQPIKTEFSLKSFVDHAEFSVENPNEFLQEVSPAYTFNIKTNTPMFIMHGANDLLVPATQANDMFTAMQTKYGTSSCNPNEFSCQLKQINYPDCGHGWINGENGSCNKNEIMNNIIEWMNSH